jgi:hypothetical protein
VSIPAGRYVVEVCKPTPSEVRFAPARRALAKRFPTQDEAEKFYVATVAVWQQKANREHTSYVARCYATRTKDTTQPVEVFTETRIEPIR